MLSLEASADHSTKRGGTRGLVTPCTRTWPKLCPKLSQQGIVDCGWQAGAAVQPGVP